MDVRAWLVGLWRIQLHGLWSEEYLVHQRSLCSAGKRTRRSLNTFDRTDGSGRRQLQVQLRRSRRREVLIADLVSTNSSPGIDRGFFVPGISLSSIFGRVENWRRRREQPGYF